MSASYVTNSQGIVFLSLHLELVLSTGNFPFSFLGVEERQQVVVHHTQVFWEPSFKQRWTGPQLYFSLWAYLDCCIHSFNKCPQGKSLSQLLLISWVPTCIYLVLDPSVFLIRKKCISKDLKILHQLILVPFSDKIIQDICHIARNGIPSASAWGLRVNFNASFLGLPLFLFYMLSLPRKFYSIFTTRVLLTNYSLSCFLWLLK